MLNIPLGVYNKDSSYRRNALLFRGMPISQLPTNRIFAYATHFDATPLGLEWVDDSTCVLVFGSSTAARDALQLLARDAFELPNADGFVHARSIPMTFWPPEERINASLGKSEGLRGAVLVRWALSSDVKKKGARAESEFYRKHGTEAGKDAAHKSDLSERITDDLGNSTKRRRREEDAHAPSRAELDDELDAFLREDSSQEEREPPSKMRSENMDDKSLLQRTSIIRVHPPRDRWAHDDTDTPRRRVGSGREERGGRDTRENGRGNARPRKTQQELDDELDSFLNDRA